ncbi:hypothetical protein [Phaffia rhodozyma]|uniref:Uncharacterized protein n=1 Tax=Phaffia rhodozyma TaxID=264483 RepID=A0A0F7SP33_PHARH|nr:hypothetical protein [Phaffia rhodozyma]
MAICHSHLDLQDIQEGSSVRSFSLSPTFREARLHEPSRVEHSSARSKISLPDDKSSRLSAHNQTSTSTLTKRHSRAVEFEPVTHIIVLPDAEKGKPRVQLRRMSMSLSFSKAPSEESLDDPSFIPTSPRRICRQLRIQLDEIGPSKYWTRQVIHIAQDLAYITKRTSP